MGCYVNPSSESKESFLQREGKETNRVSWSNKPEGTLPVCLVDNGFFQAAGVMYSERELEAFTNPSDYRLKRFFYVPIEKLSLVSPIAEYL